MSALADRPFAVVAIKTDGRRALFGRYPTEAQAGETVAALRRVGLGAEVMTGDGLPEYPGQAVDVPASARAERR